jgi:hypothetical protein
MKYSINSFIPNWKSLVYIFIPGWLGFIPFLILLYHYRISLGLIKLFEHYEYLFLFCFFNITALGLVFNELGSWVESWYDKILGCNNENFILRWRKYLLLNKKECNSLVINSIIDGVVIRLKFGINTSISLLVLLLSFPVLKWQNIIVWHSGWLISFIIILALLIFILIKTSFEMAEGLDGYRSLLIGHLNRNEENQPE